MRVLSCVSESCVWTLCGIRGTQETPAYVGFYSQNLVYTGHVIDITPCHWICPVPILTTRKYRWVPRWTDLVRWGSRTGFDLQSWNFPFLLFLTRSLFYSKCSYTISFIHWQLVGLLLVITVDVHTLGNFVPRFLFASSWWMNAGSWGGFSPPGKDACRAVLQVIRGLREYCPQMV